MEKNIAMNNTTNSNTDTTLQEFIELVDKLDYEKLQKLQRFLIMLKTDQQFSAKLNEVQKMNELQKKSRYVEILKEYDLF